MTAASSRNAAELVPLIHEHLAAAAMQGAAEGSHTYAAAKAMTEKQARKLARAIDARRPTETTQRGES